MVSGSKLTILLMILMVSRPTNTCGPGLISKSRPTNFYVRKRQPDVPEDSESASGKFKRPLKMDDPQLVRISSTQIEFKSKIRDAKCRMATQQCKDSLLRLADVVETHWSKKYKLLVRYAYLEQKDIHSSKNKNVFKNKSLHLEGRAFDLKLIEPRRRRLSSRSLRRIDMNLPTLAGLAYYEAEFSFVEVKPHHIHVSCTKTGNKKRSRLFLTKFSRCFPENASVRREDGRRIRMKDIKVGERVMTLTADGRPTYSEVTMMMDRQTNVTVADYVRITTASRKTITLSMYHLIPILRINSTQREFVFSKDVRAHEHQVLVYDEGGGAAVKSLVTSVENVRGRGAYAPLTMEGTVVVDDVFTSCYASFPSHFISHLVFLIWRTFYTLLSQMLDLTAIGEGIHWYPNVFRTAVNALPLLPYQL